MNKQLKDFKGYHIYDDGRVYSDKSNRFIAPSVCRGYKTIRLWERNKQHTKRVGRLVAEHFICDSKPGLEVNHIDGNKLNDNVNNLEWVTRSENILHSYRIGLRQKPRSNRKLTDKQVISIYKLKGKITYHDIANKFNTNYSNVAHIMRGSRWGELTKGL